MSKVIADPEKVILSELDLRKVIEASSFVYYRLHGSPLIYKSKYSTEWIHRIEKEMKVYRESGIESWCIFDNTTFGFATENALDLGLAFMPKMP